MAQYYFASSSLPMLLFDSKAPISLAQFISTVESCLSPNDAKKVLASTVDGTKPSGKLTKLGEAFWSYEEGLRNELVKVRASLLGFDAKNYLTSSSDNPYVTEVASSATKATSPLEAELILNQYRWKIVDQLQSNHYFDADFFAGYYIKLQLLTRRDSFDVEIGKENFKTVYDNVLNSNPNTNGGV